jgi:protein-S-isoprenylcysteine O-methyltransferase Ste14
MTSPRARAIVAVTYAVVAYATFVVTTGWAIGFLADAATPRGIDHGARRPAVAAVAIDGALLALFALQHTVMARAAVKRWYARWVPAPAERSTYVLASSLVLALLLWRWEPIGGRIWVLDGAAATAAWSVFAAGWLVAVSSTFMIDHLDFLGLRRAHRFARGRPQEPPAFRERWLYAWVRHPLMLGLVVAFWATPNMTGGHLLFAVCATAYVAIGVQFEERDLRRELGDVYGEYAVRVPAVLPYRRPVRDGGAPPRAVVTAAACRDHPMTR